MLMTKERRPAIRTLRGWAIILRQSEEASGGNADIPGGPRRVKLRRTQCEQMSSGLPLKADIAQYSRHFAFVP